MLVFIIRYIIKYNQRLKVVNLLKRKINRIEQIGFYILVYTIYYYILYLLILNYN